MSFKTLRSPLRVPLKGSFKGFSKGTVMGTLEGTLNGTSKEPLKDLRVLRGFRGLGCERVLGFLLRVPLRIRQRFRIQL